jgi:hypothetical protein
MQFISVKNKVTDVRRKPISTNHNEKLLNSPPLRNDVCVYLEHAKRDSTIRSSLVRRGYGEVMFF